MLKCQAPAPPIFCKPQAILGSSAAALVGMENASCSDHATNRGQVASGWLSPLLEMALPGRSGRVIDTRYENPHYMVEDAGAADLISGGRLQLGISRGSPEQVIDGWRYFGYRSTKGEDDADMGRRHAEEFLELLRGKGFAQPNPRPMFPNPPGLLRPEPHSARLRDRIWWGSAPTRRQNGPRS